MLFILFFGNHYTMITWNPTANFLLPSFNSTGYTPQPQSTFVAPLKSDTFTRFGTEDDLARQRKLRQIRNETREQNRQITDDELGKRRTKKAEIEEFQDRGYAIKNLKAAAREALMDGDPLTANDLHQASRQVADGVIIKDDKTDQ